MKPALEIAVCGCGPAGLAAALLLHRAGHRITIFERFDSPRPLGSGLLLQPTGLAVLAELGVLGRILELGAPIDQLFGRAAPSNRVALSVRYDALGNGFKAVGIHRAALFDALHDEASREKIAIESNAHIGRILLDEKKAALEFKDGRRSAGFDLIIDALGANSTLANHGARRTVLEYGALWFNAPWPTESQNSGSFNAKMLEQRYSRASRMIGILPIGKRSASGPNLAACFWSLKRSDYAPWRDRGIAKWHDDVERLWPDAMGFFSHARAVDDLTFAQYDHFTAACPYSQRLAHIGDAGHATSPQLGQGANMALLDALALARAIEHSDTIEAALVRYADMRRWHVRLFQIASAIFTPFYQSDSRLLPLLRDWVTVPLARMPIGDRVVARLVSGMTVSPLKGVAFDPLRIGD